MVAKDQRLARKILGSVLRWLGVDFVHVVPRNNKVPHVSSNTVNSPANASLN